MTTEFRFAQFSDCHLFADCHALHHGANVYQNLVAVFKDISKDNQLDAVIFTGDLTQDHEQAAYRHFANAVTQHLTNDVPVYCVAGNHDDVHLLEQTFSAQPFDDKRIIETAHWQIQLLSSKGDTPAGYWSNNEHARLLKVADRSKNQLLLIHHHPVDVGYFIDRHGLENKTQFVTSLEQLAKVKGILCGHVHNAYELSIAINGQTVPVYTCPATSIQFDIKATTVANAGLNPGYRVVALSSDGQIHTQVKFVAP